MTTQTQQAGHSHFGPNDLSWNRDPDFVAELEGNGWGSIESPSQADFYHCLYNFLEEADYQQNGTPSWVYDYYMGQVDDEDRYNQWQNMTDGITDGIQKDGDQHLQEYQEHVQHTEESHCNLVAQCESWPQQEPHWNGPPIHCSYAQVAIPYETLPEIPSDNWDANYFKVNDLVSMTIGKGGCYLKQLTERYGLHYIWYQPNPLGLEKPTLADGRFEIWGRVDRIDNAVAALQHHLEMMVFDIWHEWNSYCCDSDSDSDGYSQYSDCSGCERFPEGSESE